MKKEWQKISDFGLSRENLYSSTSDSKIPVRWSSPEMLHQLELTSKTDVFSYGVLLWELFSFGCVPYADLSNVQVSTIVMNGETPKYLVQPHQCPDFIFQIMLKCWQMDQNKRPSFLEILQLFPKSQPVPKTAPNPILMHDYASVKLYYN